MACREDSTESAEGHMGQGIMSVNFHCFHGLLLEASYGVLLRDQPTLKAPSTHSRATLPEECTRRSYIPEIVSRLVAWRHPLVLSSAASQDQVLRHGVSELA